MGEKGCSPVLSVTLNWIYRAYGSLIVEPFGFRYSVDQSLHELPGFRVSLVLVCKTMSVFGLEMFSLQDIVSQIAGESASQTSEVRVPIGLLAVTFALMDIVYSPGVQSDFEYRCVTFPVL